MASRRGTDGRGGSDRSACSTWAIRRSGASVSASSAWSLSWSRSEDIVTPHEQSWLSARIWQASGSA